jgi:phenylpropionate dioxygenase-like ring-hydroxylating dioxygenase large terminal subunit
MTIRAMTEEITIEAATLDQWYVVDRLDRAPGMRADRLLGVDLAITRDRAGVITVIAEGRAAPLPTRGLYGCLWTTLGAPAQEPPDIAEAGEGDRRLVVCGGVSVAASGPRVVENFLDMAHFPFVHADILGAEPHTEVASYKTEIRRDADEVWATECRFFQPQAALSASGGIVTRYEYRVAAPLATLLYKTCPTAESRRDVIALFVQPLDPDRCRAHPVMFLIDDAAPLGALVQFQQMIFLQDKIILENQRPRLLPLAPRAEIPTRADATSIAYRRWLKQKGVRYGTVEG